MNDLPEEDRPKARKNALIHLYMRSIDNLMSDYLITISFY